MLVKSRLYHFVEKAVLWVCHVVGGLDNACVVPYCGPMTIYLKQRWVITLDDFIQFARERGWEEDDIQDAMQSWDLFGDGRDCNAEFERADPAGFEDDTLGAIFIKLFEEHPDVEQVFVSR